MIFCGTYPLYWVTRTGFRYVSSKIEFGHTDCAETIDQGPNRLRRFVNDGRGDGMEVRPAGLVWHSLERGVQTWLFPLRIRSDVWVFLFCYPEKHLAYEGYIKSKLVWVGIAGKAMWVWLRRG